MNKSKRFTVFVPLVSIFAALSLSAMAQEPPKKPPQKAPTVQQRVPAKPGPQVNRPAQRPAGPGPTANSGTHFDRDSSHWSDRDHRAWSGGHWRPYECRFGRCGYWWWADGYWYFYDHPMDGPPVDVSDIEYSDAPVEQVLVPPPPPPGQDAVGGAIGGAILGGILGGVLTGRPGGAAVGAIIGGTTGAAIGAQAEQRNGYYLWQGACYYRYPTGEYAVIDPRYCN
jgi:outer membrane protein with glycine zipper